jgi:hypothetical protein
MLLSERKTSLPLTEEHLRRGAWACFMNARDLYEEACLLGSHARYPRAAVLAVIGTEEFVTAVAYTLAALNPQERLRLPQTLRALRHHDIQHVSGATIEGVCIEVREEVDAEASLAGVPVTPGSYVQRTLLALARGGLQRLLHSTEVAKEQRQALNAIAPNSVPSGAKERGLYVEMRYDELSTPSQLEEWEASSMLIELEWFLNTFHGLPSVLEDNLAWQPFAETIRQQLC